MILGSYAEMPGLRLSVEQAARLFALTAATCREVLDALVQQGRLRRDAQDHYLTAE